MDDVGVTVRAGRGVKEGVIGVRVAARLISGVKEGISGVSVAVRTILGIEDGIDGVAVRAILGTEEGTLVGAVVGTEQAVRYNMKMNQNVPDKRLRIMNSQWVDKAQDNTAR